jgi:hypothetical protein
VTWIVREPPAPIGAQSHPPASSEPRTTPFAEVPQAIDEKPAKPATSPRAVPSARLAPSPPASSVAPGSEAVSPAGPAIAPGSTGSASTLNEENRLFQEASAAERAGDNDGAVGTLDRLVRDFPRSPLVQNAMVRKFRVLARAGRKAEAAAAARDYLRAFPLGFAKPEAEGIAAPDPQGPKGTDRE